MTKTNVIICIIFILILLVILSIILYRFKGDKLVNLKNKLDNTEEDYLSKLKVKKDVLLSLIDIVETKYKVDSKVFDEVKKIDFDNDQAYDSEKLLNKCYQEIIHIIEDHSKVKQTKALKEILKKYDETELYIISIRTFHNKYTLIYNNVIKKFPYNIISKIKRFKIKSLIEGKELDNNYNNDLEV